MLIRTKRSRIRIKISGTEEIRSGLITRNRSGIAADGGQDQVRERAGRRDDRLATSAAREVHRVDRRGFRPAEREGALRDQERHGQDDAADRVEVGDRVERQASEHLGGPVAEPVRGPARGRTRGPGIPTSSMIAMTMTIETSCSWDKRHL